MKKPTKAALIERITQIDPEQKGLSKKKHADLVKLVAKLERKPTKSAKPAPVIPVAKIAKPLPIAVIAPPIARFAPPVKVDTRTPIVAGWLMLIVVRVMAMVEPAMKSF